MHLRSPFRGLVAVLSVAVGGCLLPSVDLLGAPRAPADAGADARTEASVDAVGDSSVDASPPFDCVGAAFCATFDTNPDVMTGWTGKFQSNGSTLARDTARFRSPPAGFLATTVAGTKNDYFAAGLYKSLPRGAANVFRWRFSARVSKLDPTDRLTVADLIHYVDVDNWSSARVWVDNGTLNLEEEASVAGSVTVNVQHEVANAWAIDQWMQLEVNVDVAKRQATLFRDGVVVVAFALTSSWTGPDVEAALGVYYSSGTQSGHQVVYDDARLDLTP